MSVIDRFASVVYTVFTISNYIIFYPINITWKQYTINRMAHEELHYLKKKMSFFLNVCPVLIFLLHSLKIAILF